MPVRCWGHRSRGHPRDNWLRGSGLNDPRNTAIGPVELELVFFDKPDCVPVRTVESPAAVGPVANQYAFAQLGIWGRSPTGKRLGDVAANHFGKMCVVHAVGRAAWNATGCLCLTFPRPLQNASALARAISLHDAYSPHSFRGLPHVSKANCRRQHG